MSRVARILVVSVSALLLPMEEMHVAEAAARDGALQRAFPRFLLVDSVIDAADRSVPVTITLNANAVIEGGIRYDGFRIRTPHKPGTLFVWSFVKTANMSGWFIVPEKGSIRGFERFFHQTDAQGRTTFMQSLDTSQLSPGKDYLIWFSFKDESVAEVTVWHRFASPGTKPSGFAGIRSVLNPAPAPVGGKS